MISKCKTIILLPRNNYILLMFWYFLLLILTWRTFLERIEEREGGRDRDRHKDINVKETHLLVPPELAPTVARDRTCNPDTCPCALDRESRSFPAQVDNLTTEPGQFGYFFDT